jgi:DNA-binding XRE family transcriptional regulator
MCVINNLWNTIRNKGGDNMAQPKSKLEYLRKINFFTQAEVAEQLGVTQSYYHKVERGKRDLTLKLAKRLKDLFKVSSIDDLLDEAC